MPPWFVEDPSCRGRRRESRRSSLRRQMFSKKVETCPPRFHRNQTRREICATRIPPLDAAADVETVDFHAAWERAEYNPLILVRILTSDESGPGRHDRVVFSLSK